MARKLQRKGKSSNRGDTRFKADALALLAGDDSPDGAAAAEAIELAWDHYQRSLGRDVEGRRALLVIRLLECCRLAHRNAVFNATTCVRLTSDDPALSKAPEAAWRAAIQAWRGKVPLRRGARPSGSKVYDWRSVVADLLAHTTNTKPDSLRKRVEQAGATFPLAD